MTKFEHGAMLLSPNLTTFQSQATQTLSDIGALCVD